MITVIQDIPDYSFLSALSELVFTTSESGAAIVLKHGGTEILHETYVPDSSGRIRIRELDVLLEPYLLTNLIETFVYSIDDGISTKQKQFTVQYCTVEVPYPATHFMQNYFLSSLMGAKFTSMGRKEFVHLVASAPCEVVAECCYLMNVSTTVVNETVLSVTELNKVVSVEVSPELFVRDGWKLIHYNVKAGARVQQFLVDRNSPDAAPCLLFTNSFGCQKTLYCTRSHQVAPEYKRDAAYIDGKYRNFKIDENRVFKANTGILNTHMAGWADDLFRSPEIYLLVNSLPDKEITITDSKSERANDNDALPAFSFDYRYAQRNHNILQLGKAGRVFDNTFDNTFE